MATVRAKVATKKAPPPPPPAAKGGELATIKHDLGKFKVDTTAWINQVIDTESEFQQATVNDITALERDIGSIRSQLIGLTGIADPAKNPDKGFISSTDIIGYTVNTETLRIKRNGYFKVNSLDNLNWIIFNPDNATNGGVALSISGSMKLIGNSYFEGSIVATGEVKSNNYVPGTSGWRIYGTDGTAEFSNITIRGAVYGSSGTIGDWIIDTDVIKSASSGARIELRKSKSRISIFDSLGVEKVAMGYLEGLIDPADGVTPLPSSAYGFWALAGNTIDFRANTTFNANMLFNNQSLDINNGSAIRTIRLGDESGILGLHLYNSLGVEKGRIYFDTSVNKMKMQSVGGVDIESNNSAIRFFTGYTGTLGSGTEKASIDMGGAMKIGWTDNGGFNGNWTLETKDFSGVTSVAQYPIFFLNRMNSSRTSPTKILSGNEIGRLSFGGTYDTNPNNRTDGAYIKSNALADWTSTTVHQASIIIGLSPASGSIVDAFTFTSQKLDILSGDSSGVLNIGADLNSNTRTNLTSKYGLITFAPYTNANIPVSAIRTISSSANDELAFGMGSGTSVNSPTLITFYPTQTKDTYSTSALLTVGGTTKDIYSTPLTNYEATSTIIGWSSFTTKLILLKTVGRILYCWFAISGTSNSTSTSFTITGGTSASGAMIGNQNFSIPQATDNSANVAGAKAQIGALSQVVNLYKTGAGGAWTASGTKAVYGFIAIVLS